MGGWARAGPGPARAGPGPAPGPAVPDLGEGLEDLDLPALILRNLWEIWTCRP